MYHYTDGGLRNVWLANGYTERVTPYGKAVAIHDLDGLAKAVCMALVDKAGHLTGVEFRYIRQSGMALSQQALGKMLGTDGQSVARWEKSGRVPKWADKLIRLVYVAQANGNEPIKRAIARIQTVERLVNQRIVIEDAGGRWRSELRTDDNEEAFPA